MSNPPIPKCIFTTVLAIPKTKRTVVITINSSIRVQHICSDISDFEIHDNTILTYYKYRCYPASILTEALTKAQALNRDSLLARQLTNRDCPEDRLFCTITYHPRNPPILKILNKNQHILKISLYLECIANKQVMIGQRHNKNLKYLLVPSASVTRPSQKQV